MANVKNLEKGKQTQFKSGEEAVKNGRKGGIASGEAKRAKKSRRELALAIANAQVTNKKIKDMVKRNTGFEDDEITGDAAVVNGVYLEALSGNMQAYDRWERLTAEDKSGKDDYELPARVLGKAFVDINRQIKPNIEYVFEGGRGGLKSSFVGFKIIELI